MQTISEILAIKIKEEYSKAEELANQAKESVCDAVKHAVACGELLIEVQGLSKNFAYWLGENVPEIKIATAKRFISGAKRMRDAEIEGGARQLLMFFCGDDEGDEERKQTNRDPSGKNWLTDLGKICERINKTIDHQPLAEWGVEDKEVFKQKMKPLVEIYNKL